MVVECSRRTVGADNNGRMGMLKRDRQNIVVCRLTQAG
jgi:hypothetical protein